jgi:hypothetical protein
MVAAGIGVILLFPWVIGIRATYGDSAWGPGFELRDFDRPPSNQGFKAWMVVGAGSAIPTPEGPRPLWGHGGVLLGGGWRDLANARAAGRERLAELAIKESVPLLSLNGSAPLVVVEFAKRGYEPLDSPFGRANPSGLYASRTFRDIQGESIVVLRPAQRPERVGDWAWEAIDELELEEVSIFGFTSSMRQIQNTQLGELMVLGPEEAFLRMDRTR